jgi:hypothetical protein
MAAGPTRGATHYCTATASDRSTTDRSTSGRPGRRAAGGSRRHMAAHDLATHHRHGRLPLALHHGAGRACPSSPPRRRPKEDLGDLRASILRPRSTWPHKQMRPLSSWLTTHDAGASSLLQLTNRKVCPLTLPRIKQLLAMIGSQHGALSLGYLNNRRAEHACEIPQLGLVWHLSILFSCSCAGIKKWCSSPNL